MDNKYTYVFLSSWLSVGHKLSNLVEIWQGSDKKKLGHFLAHPVNFARLQAMQGFAVGTDVKQPESMQ